MQGKNNRSDYGKRAEYHVAHLLNHYCLRNENGHELARTLNVIFLELPKIAKESDDISKITGLDIEAIKALNQ